MTNVEDIVNKEYIDKHEAYLLLKHKAETYMLPATKETYEKAAILIDSLPTIEAEPVKYGRWVRKHNSFPQRYFCTECGGGDVGRFAFCHHCGARMRMDGGGE